MTEPAPAPKLDDVIQASVGLADTPVGQRLAVTVTVFLGREGALAVASEITRLAGTMSASGLVVPAPAGNGITPKAAP